MNSEIKIIECPRDAMQGIRDFISTKSKIDYINQLLKVGFHTIDFGPLCVSKGYTTVKRYCRSIGVYKFSKTLSSKLLIIMNYRGFNQLVCLRK